MNLGTAKMALAVRILSALILVVGSTSIARADWSEDFDGGFSQSWTFEAVDDVGDPPATGVSEFAVIDAGKLHDNRSIAKSKPSAKNSPS